MRALLLLALLIAPLPALAQVVTVFAAASLSDAMRDISVLWAQAGHRPLRLSFGSSSTLARQVEQGAPADVYASADEKWTDYLAARNLLAPDTLRSLLGNDLVLIVPADRARSIRLDAMLDVAAVLGPGGRLATGDPKHVPVGIYAEQALRKLGLWDQVRPRLAGTEDVRAALLLVERGEAPAISKGVAVAAVFPDDSHDAISYSFAVTKSGDTAAARAFMAFLGSPAARDAFVRRGFKVQ